MEANGHDRFTLLVLEMERQDKNSTEYDEQGHNLEVRDVTHKSDDREGVALAAGIGLMFADVEGNLVYRTRSTSRIKTVYDQ